MFATARGDLCELKPQTLAYSEVVVALMEPASYLAGRISPLTNNLRRLGLNSEHRKIVGTTRSRSGRTDGACDQPGREQSRSDRAPLAIRKRRLLTEPDSVSWRHKHQLNARESELAALPALPLLHFGTLFLQLFPRPVVASGGHRSQRQHCRAALIIAKRTSCWAENASSMRVRHFSQNERPRSPVESGACELGIFPASARPSVEKTASGETVVPVWRKRRPPVSQLSS